MKANHLNILSTIFEMLKNVFSKINPATLCLELD